jgi:Surface antigen
MKKVLLLALVFHLSNANADALPIGSKVNLVVPVKRVEVPVAPCHKVAAVAPVIIEKEVVASAPIVVEKEVIREVEVIKEVSTVAPYIRLGGGYGSEDGIHSDNDGVLYTGAVGVDLTKKAAVEVEYNRHDFDGVRDTDSHSTMLNGIYNILPNQTVSPFVALGVGHAFSSINLPSQAAINSLAYQAKAGLNVKLTNNIDGLIAYRYFKADNFDGDFSPNKFKGGINPNIRFQTLEGGVKVKF